MHVRLAVAQLIMISVAQHDELLSFPGLRRNMSIPSSHSSRSGTPPDSVLPVRSVSRSSSVCSGPNNSNSGVTRRGYPQSKYWCFTLNNFSTDDEERIKRQGQACQDSESSSITYLVFGIESGSSGTPHLQGYVEFRSRARLSSVKRLLGGNPHLEVRRGTSIQASEYCKKDGSYQEFGVLSKGRGERTDLLQLQEAIQAGASLREIANEHFGSYLRYQKAIHNARDLYAIPRTWVCSVIVYWGKTGTGKTSSVFDNLALMEDIYVHPGGPWFDGYDGHPIALFDDFGGSEFRITYLLKLLDCYPMRVPVKGAHVTWRPYEIYLTSNMDPNDWYRHANPEHVNALMRRITNCVYFE